MAADLQDRLAGMGYETDGVVSRGEDALPKAAESAADLVLMDIVLKGSIDGVEAAAQIRDAFDLPVVFLTAYADDATFQRAKVTSPFGYVLKPFDDRELRTAVEFAFYRHTAEMRIRKMQQWLQTIVESIGDALIVTDTWGLVVLMNSAACSLCQCRSETTHLKPLNELVRFIDPANHQPVDWGIGKLLYEEVIVHWRRPVLLRTSDGAKTLIDFSVSPISDERDRVTGYVWLFTKRNRSGPLPQPSPRTLSFPLESE